MCALAVLEARGQSARGALRSRVRPPPQSSCMKAPFEGIKRFLQLRSRAVPAAWVAQARGRLLALARALAGRQASLRKG